MNAAQAVRSLDRLLAPVVGIALAISVILFSYALVSPVPIADYKRWPDKTDVVAGDVVTITAIVQRTDTCASVAYRKLISEDGRVIEFEPLRIPPLPPNTEKFSTHFTVPQGLAPGTLIYRVRSEFHCNWIQRIFGGSVLVLPDIELTYRG